MIQDIAPHKFDNQYKENVQVEKGDILFLFSNRKVMCRIDDDGNVYFPDAYASVMAGFEQKKMTYLFSIDSRKYFLLRFYRDDADSLMMQQKLFTDHHFENLSVLRGLRPKTECFAAETAYHLYVWYKNTRFCGRCGHKMAYSGKERARVCNECGNTVYPRIMPAVIVGVTKGEQILVSHYSGREYKGIALLAGFTEIGETAEETVIREVKEEVGLTVKNVRYFKSQPWGFDSDLLLGFYCDADPDEEIVIDENELSNAGFINRDEIGEENADLSLTATMIMNFKKYGRKGTFAENLT